MLTATDALVAAGYEPRPEGLVRISGPAARLFDGWRTYLPHRLASMYDIRVDVPEQIDHDILRVSRYSSLFPHQVVSVPGSRESTSGDALTPAACLHLYARVANEQPELPVRAFVSGTCARNEGGSWRFPMRLSRFHMVEVVTIGSEADVREAARQAEGILLSTFDDLGIAGALRAGSDAFFAGEDAGARMMQMLKQLKHEFVAQTEEGAAALASLNLHEDAFGERFGITTPDGRAALSCCLAFGLERLTAAGLLQWGPDSAHWPMVLRT